jgi:hypothetical protein
MKQASAIMKKAPALHLARKGKDELEMKTKESTHEPHAKGGGDDAGGRLQGGKGRHSKNGPGGRRNALIRLDSTKEIQGFPWLYYLRALLDKARICLD